ncbi:MAG: S-layer homology domain-containing protein [Clostridia bacterium]|nr:S-layer homology domain-containing protein [Clostridia bacterium]
MKKIISCIIAVAILCCSAVAFAGEKEVVIDTEVPVFKDLVDGSSYSGSKKVEIADLSEVDCVILRSGNGTVSFAGKTFSGYVKVAEKQNLKCINYTEVATISSAGSYMVYAIDIHNHDIAVRFKVTKPGVINGGGGGGGGGGGSGAIVTVKPPYANGNPDNTKGNIVAGGKITLESDTGNTKIYFTTDGTTPTSKSSLYDEEKGIVLTEGQILKAVAIKNGNASDVSQWEVIASSFGNGESLVKDTLETEKHIVYMNGYPEGTFGPNNNMTRAEVATMFARLMKDAMDAGATYNSSFADVTSDAWYYNYVGYIEKSGIITGYEDGTFRPQNTITRAEFVTMATRFADMSQKYECSFVDVTKEHWAYDYIAFAAQNNWVGGYEDNSFKADNTITRAEVVTIVNNMLNRNADKEYVKANNSSLVLFSDINEEHWAYYDVIEATNAHNYIVTDKIEKWQ